MSMDVSLPPGYESLETYVDDWVHDSASARLACRLDSTEEQRVAFYNAIKDHVAPALEQLDEKPLAELNAKEQRLMKLVLSAVHASLAVEIQGDAEPQHARDARYICITRAPSEEIN